MFGLSLVMALVIQSLQPNIDEIRMQSERCGFIFNVDGPGPAGDGIYISKDRRTLLLEKRRNEAAKRNCLATTWAKDRGLKIRYIPLPR